MTGSITPSALDAVLVGSCLLLVAGTVGYHRERERVARPATVGGFVLLGGALAVLTVGYATSGRSDRLFLAATSGAGLVVSLQAVRLTAFGWSRRAQLARTAATVLVVMLPFELYPALQVAIQETLATQVVTVATTLGYQPGLEATADGQLTRLTFDNGGYYRIARECTGLDGIALFTGILVGVRTTRRRRLAGFAFVLVAVYAVNMLRMVFVVAAMSTNWFGWLLTGDDTVQTSYYVAEVAIGQPLVVLASVAGYLWVSQWIPDGIDFATEFFDTFDYTGRRNL